MSEPLVNKADETHRARMVEILQDTYPDRIPLVDRIADRWISPSQGLMRWKLRTCGTRIRDLGEYMHDSGGYDRFNIALAMVRLTEEVQHWFDLYRAFSGQEDPAAFFAGEETRVPDPMASDPGHTRFCERLQHAREAMHLSQQDAAAMVGMHPSGWSNCERGIATPGMLTIPLICKALNVSADWLLGMTEKPPEETP